MGQEFVTCKFFDVVWAGHPVARRQECLSSVISLTHAGQMWTILLAVLHVLHLHAIPSLSSCLGFRWVLFPCVLLASIFSAQLAWPAALAFCSLLLLTRASLKWLPAMFSLNPTHTHTQTDAHTHTDAHTSISRVLCDMVIAAASVCVFVPSPRA